MTKTTQHMSEAELAEYYDTHRDADEWGGPEPVEHAERREVTISVRFSEHEINKIREWAGIAGMKPTAYIREAVLRLSAGEPERSAIQVAEEVKLLTEIAAAMTALERVEGKLTKVQAAAPTGAVRKTSALRGDARSGRWTRKKGATRGQERATNKGDIHTLYSGGQWQNRVEGNDQPASTAATKAEAQAKGRELARTSGVEHHIHNRDGTIAERYSYGNDPAGSRAR